MNGVSEVATVPPHMTRMSTVAVVAYALSVGLVAACLEVLIWAFRGLVFGQFIMSSWQIVWLTPLSYCVMLLAPALLAAGATRLWPRIVTAPFVIFSSVAGAAFFVLFLFHPKLHLAANAVLSIGAAVQVTRMVGTEVERFMVRTRRVGAVLLVLAAAAGLCIDGTRVFRERRALAATPAAVPGAPNVLLLVLDTVRAPSLSLYGYSRATSPSIERFASRGVAFTHAFATAPWTLPSHATLLTGRYPMELSANWETPLDPHVPTLAGVLRERGYATAGFVANVAYTSRETGIARDFHHYEDYVVRWSDLVVSSSPGRFLSNNPRLRAMVGYHDVLGRRTAADIRLRVGRWLDTVEGRPFFAFLNFYDAHEPYLPPAPFDMAFGPVGYRNLGEIRQLNAHMAERHEKWSMPVEERGEEQRAYDQAIAYLDDQIGGLLDDLGRRGQLQNTVVVITSDHGELFGEHQLFSHGNSLYLPALHVPLVIIYPPRLERGVRDGVTTLRDVPATILDLAGLGSAALLPGRSLFQGGRDAVKGSAVISAIEPPPNQRAAYPSARGPMRSLLTDGEHYIRNGDGTEELYRWRSDPAEAHDLASSEGSRAALEALRATLAQTEARSPRR